MSEKFRGSLGARYRNREQRVSTVCRMPVKLGGVGKKRGPEEVQRNGGPTWAIRKGKTLKAVSACGERDGKKGAWGADGHCC